MVRTAAGNCRFISEWLIPIRLTRTYRELDSGARAFGLGMASNYDLQIVVDESGSYAWVPADSPH